MWMKKERGGGGKKQAREWRGEEGGQWLGVTGEMSDNEK